MFAWLVGCWNLFTTVTISAEDPIVLKIAKNVVKFSNLCHCTPKKRRKVTLLSIAKDT